MEIFPTEAEDRPKLDILARNKFISYGANFNPFAMTCVVHEGFFNQNTEQYYSSSIYTPRNIANWYLSSAKELLQTNSDEKKLEGLIKLFYYTQILRQGSVSIQNIAYKIHDYDEQKSIAEALGCLDLIYKIVRISDKKINDASEKKINLSPEDLKVLEEISILGTIAKITEMVMQLCGHNKKNIPRDILEIVDPLAVNKNTFLQQIKYFFFPPKEPDFLIRCQSYLESAKTIATEKIYITILKRLTVRLLDFENSYSHHNTKFASLVDKKLSHLCNALIEIWNIWQSRDKDDSDEEYSEITKEIIYDKKSSDMLQEKFVTHMTFLTPAYQSSVRDNSEVVISNIKSQENKKALNN